MAFDASPSWSGFNYQGKVALYYALRMINAIPAGSNLSNYSLMLEDIEDFEILHNGNSISIHQVKAYNSSSYSKYSDALLEITLELYKQPAIEGKLHTWKPVNFKPNFSNLNDSIKDDLKCILDQYQNTNPKNGSSILEKAVSTEIRKPKRASILKAAFPELDESQLFTLLNDIYEGNNDTLTRLNFCQYDDGNLFCGLEEINEKIKSKLAEAWLARGIIDTPEHQEKKFHFFLGMMDQYIIQRHLAKPTDDKISISFDEIIQALETDHEDIGKEYLACRFKEKFARLIDEYIDDPQDYEEPDEGKNCNLKEARKILLSLSPQHLWEHYRSFCPHIYLEHGNNTDNALDTDPDGIRYVLIKILHEINFERASHNASKNKFIYRSTALPSKIYLPTTITNTARVSQIERKITSNPSMSEILFEVENLIYSGLESHSFSPTSMAHTEAPPAEDEDSRSKRDEVLKQITLVPIHAAKDALT